MKDMIRIGVVGYGYWGPNLVRNFAESTGTAVAGISDVRPERLAVAQNRYPGVKTFTDHRELIQDPETDAIVVATPVVSHFDLAWESL
jgi:predicted dehydrogenase